MWVAACWPLEARNLEYDADHDGFEDCHAVTRAELVED
jgi:hypothetical protein